MLSILIREASGILTKFGVHQEPDNEYSELITIAKELRESYR
jgi:hypothetical protein